MKKKIFMVLSAVIVLAMGVLVVACSKDSNALNPNEEIVVEEVAPGPTLQKTNSAAEWAAFNLEVEKLNAKYLAPEVVGRAMRVGKDSGELSQEQKDEIWQVDAEGATWGWRIGGLVGEIIGGCAGNPVVGKWSGRIAGAVVVGGVCSALKWNELTGGCGLMVSVNPLPKIDDLETDSLAAIVGEQHNMIIEDFINNPINLVSLSDSLILIDFTNRYERIFGAIQDSVKVLITSTNLNEVHDFSPEVEKVTGDFGEATFGMDDNQRHDYTEEYLEIVDANLSDSEDKMLIKTYAGVAYYSSAMWVVEE